MSLAVDLGHAVARRLPPGEEHDAARPLLRDKVDDLLREGLPAAFLVRVGRVRADGEACVEHEDAALGPGRQEPAVLRRRHERGIVVFERLVHVLERGRGGRGRAYREAKTVRLVVVVVGVLA